jgi:hypothetical protein
MASVSFPATFRGRKYETGLRPAGTKGRSFRGATRFRRLLPSLLNFRRTPKDVDRCRPDNAGALRRSLATRPPPPPGVSFGPKAPGSIRPRRRAGLHLPPALCADHRGVLLPINAHIRTEAAESRELTGRPSIAARRGFRSASRLDPSGYASARCDQPASRRARAARSYVGHRGAPGQYAVRL